MNARLPLALLATTLGAFAASPAFAAAPALLAHQAPLALNEASSAWILTSSVYTAVQA